MVKNIYAERLTYQGEVYNYTINALSEMTIRNSDIDMNLEQFKALFKDRWQHVNFIEKQ